MITGVRGPGPPDKDPNSPAMMGLCACGFRRQTILQVVFCLLAFVTCLGSVIYLYRHSQLQFQQQQETLSGLVEVMYEQRSSLEQSLEKERVEHKTQEDFGVHNLKAEEALSKEKEGAMNPDVTLPSRHMTLKNQHERAKKQLLDLQAQYNSLKLENRRALESHNQKYAQLQRENENHVEMLMDTISKLLEDSTVLRDAFEEVRAKLRSAQEQLNKMQQLNEALRRIPSYKLVPALRHHPLQLQAPDEKPSRAFDAELQRIREQTRLQANTLASPTDSGKKTPESAAQTAESVRKLLVPRTESLEVLTGLQAHTLETPTYSGKKTPESAEQNADSIRNFLVPWTGSLEVLPQPALPLWLAKDRDGSAVRF